MHAVSPAQETYSLSVPSAGRRNGELKLNIGQVPKEGGKSTFPPPDFISDKTLWEVTAYRKRADRLSADPLSIKEVILDPSYLQTGQILLVTSANYSLDAFSSKDLIVQVQFLGGGDIANVKFVGSEKGGGGKGQGGGATTPVEAAKGGSGAGCNAGPAPQQPGTSYINFCFSGIWVPQVGSQALYSSSSNFSLAMGAGARTSFGLSAQEAADSSAVLDPNAFSSAVFYQTVLTVQPGIPNLMGVLFNWNLATVEFDRKKRNTNLGTNVNLVTAPELVFPFKSFHGIGTEIDAGVETGHNFKNNINPNGFGTVFRGLLGAQAMRIYRPAHHLKALSKIKVSSQYQLRLLAEDEVITKSVHSTLVPCKGHQARNWVTGQVDFMFTNNFGLTMKYDYGALPPGFVFVQSRATVGFTIQSAQK